MTDVYLYDAHWYYMTDKGEMMCPPFVRYFDEVEKFFGSEPVRKVACHKFSGSYSIRGEVDHNGMTRRIAVKKYNEDGKLVAVYPSVLQAARLSNISTTSIRSCMTGKIQFIKGYTFRKA